MLTYTLSETQQKSCLRRKMCKLSIRLVLLVVLVEPLRAVFLAIFAGHAAIHRLCANIPLWLRGLLVVGFWSTCGCTGLACSWCGTFSSPASLTTTCICTNIGGFRLGHTGTWLLRGATSLCAPARATVPRARRTSRLVATSSTCGDSLCTALLYFLLLFCFLSLQLGFPAAFAGSHCAVPVRVAHSFPERVLHLSVSRERIQPVKQ